MPTPPSRNVTLIWRKCNSSGSTTTTSVVYAGQRVKGKEADDKLIIQAAKDFEQEGKSVCIVTGDNYKGHAKESWLAKVSVKFSFVLGRFVPLGL